MQKAKDWFKNHYMEVPSWPAQSPDLNPIEDLWQHFKRKLGEYPEPPRGILELWGRVEKEWEATPPSVCRDLLESMPRRVAAMIAAKGGYTKCRHCTINVSQMGSNKTVRMLSPQR